MPATPDVSLTTFDPCRSSGIINPFFIVIGYLKSSMMPFGHFGN
jgi:hypothetical protein